jgi:hypothetical protein
MADHVAACRVKHQRPADTAEQRRSRRPPVEPARACFVYAVLGCLKRDIKKRIDI